MRAPLLSATPNSHIEDLGMYPSMLEALQTNSEGNGLARLENYSFIHSFLRSFLPQIK